MRALISSSILEPRRSTVIASPVLCWNNAAMGSMNKLAEKKISENFINSIAGVKYVKVSLSKHGQSRLDAVSLVKLVRRRYKWRSELQSVGCRKGIAGYRPKLQLQRLRYPFWSRLYITSSLHSDQCFNFAIISDKTFDLKLRLNHRWGFHLDHFLVHPVISAFGTFMPEASLCYLTLAGTIGDDELGIQVVLQNVDLGYSSEAVKTGLDGVEQ